VKPQRVGYMLARHLISEAQRLNVDVQTFG
jgi:hypothetical protein